ncbi:MAG: phosphate/phosphite/phosphonate ABC transporter substrate-binding protein [Spirochaetes bacterium]|nr:phosphate/phosphite/phosphonate ABC transporter substrate-binding protein [Spirochaetota bacterium]
MFKHKTIIRIILIMFFPLSVSVLTASAGQAGNNIDESNPVKIDFDDVIKDNKSNANTPDRPYLRIAVAAMISPKYTYKYYIDLLRLIGSRMDMEVVFVQKQTYSEVNHMIKMRMIDLAFVCSGPYVSGHREFGMEIIAVPVCNGERVYYSYFIARKNNGIKTFRDFKGKVFAFTDPLSNTGYSVPVYYLAKMNETPENYFKRFFFTHSHDNSIKAVSRNLADGAAVDSLIYDFFKRKNPELTGNTVIIEKSPPYGMPPVVAHPELNMSIRKKLKQIFLNIHKMPEGKEILKKLEIEKFTEGRDSDYNSVRRLQKFIRLKSMEK